MDYSFRIITQTAVRKPRFALLTTLALPMREKGYRGRVESYLGNGYGDGDGSPPYLAAPLYLAAPDDARLILVF
jgi:hypothetical protein